MYPNPAELTIRRVTEEDVEGLIDIRLEALQNHPVAFSADYEKELNRPIPEWKKRTLRPQRLRPAAQGALLRWHLL